MLYWHQTKEKGGNTMDSLRIHAQTIIDDTLKQVQPHAAVQRALEGRTFPGNASSFPLAKPLGPWQKLLLIY